MNEQSNNGIKLSAAVVSDRGLSKKRPLNEDSFLSDPERRIFAVADGVGGAQAGEVASQTAMEVLDEAFRHIEPGADVEDLLEIAIQRANSSIHRMSREHPKLSMMATTVVALHLDGHIATIGHVGDSRLYRLAPDGQLHRETADHSVVEEEVRAGRMTPEQASNHPSRNVISRALGAEESVEVDLKTMEVEDGTAFLLCSDGITRHIPDQEIREILTSGMGLNEICDEMKRRCYERGAEDNLTAVIVRVGDPTKFAAMDDERTLVRERPQLAATMSGEISLDEARRSNPALDAALHDTVEMPTKSRPAEERQAVAEAAASPATEIVAPTAAAAAVPAIAPPRRRSAFKSFLRAIAFLIFLGIVGAAAFFGGMYYQRQFLGATASDTATPTPTPAVTAPKESNFEVQRKQVDTQPDKAAREMEEQTAGKPLESNSPEFLYFYGRALLLSGKDSKKALDVFNTALKKPEMQSPDNPSLKIELLFAKIAAARKVPILTEVDSAINALNEITAKNAAASGQEQPPTGAPNQSRMTPAPR